MTKEGKRVSASFQLSPRKRKSILGTPGQMAPSPASRRSILPEPIPMDESVFQDLSENNDEQEKLQRQLKRLQEKQHRDFSSPTVQGAEKRKSLSGAEGLSNQQLSDHYTKCIQLSSENKINVKNAFNLNLIDYMSEMVRRKNADMNNFQVASCTLDASTKIYAYRVDSIHTDTLKMAGGLGRTQDKKGGAEGGEDGQEGTGMEGMKKKRTKKRNTVETNIKNLNLNHYDLEYDIDPLFKKQAAQFDDGRSGKEFLCALHLLDDTCQMILDSETVIMNSALEELTSQKKQVAIPGFPDMSDKLICPTFSSFEFTSWKVEDETMNEDDDKKEDDKKEDHAFDINAEPEPLDDEPYFENDDGFGIGDVAGDDYDENGTVITVGHGAHERGPPPKMEAVNLKDYLADTQLEYSYFDTNRLTAWGGPRHWKFKPNSKEKKPTTSNNEEKKSKKENIVLAYEEPEIDKYFAITRKAIKLSQTTFKTWTKDKTTLPVDLHYDSADFHRLYGRAAIYIRRLGKESTEVDENVTEYNYDNANDENFCHDVDDGMDDYGDGDNDNDATQAGYDLTMFSQTQAPLQDGDVKPGDLFDNLVAAPNRVAKINIGYARTAKKIDMKKLKTSMWGILTEPTAIRDDKENQSGPENQVENILNVTEKMDESSSIGFNQMYKLLPTKVSKNMTDNLSVPLAFIALLHLCNEHSLQLTGREDMTDFTVKQN